MCSTKTDKRDLVRIVRTRSGKVQVDRTNSILGRGAYLCLAPVCWENALKKSRLDHKLRGAIPAEDRLALLEFASQINEFTEGDRDAVLQTGVL